MLLFTLIVEEFSWGHAGCVLEHSGEVLGVFKPQFFRHLDYRLSAKNEILGA